MEFILEGSIEFNTILGKMNIPIREKVKLVWGTPKSPRRNLDTKSISKIITVVIPFLISNCTFILKEAIIFVI